MDSVSKESKITTIRLPAAELELYTTVASLLGITFGELCRRSLQHYIVCQKDEITHVARKVLEGLGKTERIEAVLKRLRAKGILKESEKRHHYFIARGLPSSLAEKLSSSNEDEVRRLIEILKALAGEEHE
jgi:NAD-specific glutamate dehydrogenase